MTSFEAGTILLSYYKMQKEDSKNSPAKKPEKPLSETIPNAHSSGDGAIRLSEDGLIEPSEETIADAEANKEGETKQDEY